MDELDDLLDLVNLKERKVRTEPSSHKGSLRYPQTPPPTTTATKHRQSTKYQGGAGLVQAQMELLSSPMLFPQRPSSATQRGGHQEKQVQPPGGRRWQNHPQCSPVPSHSRLGANPSIVTLNTGNCATEHLTDLARDLFSTSHSTVAAIHDDHDVERMMDPLHAPLLGGVDVIHGAKEDSEYPNENHQEDDEDEGPPPPPRSCHESTAPLASLMTTGMVPDSANTKAGSEATVITPVTAVSSSTNSARLIPFDVLSGIFQYLPLNSIILVSTTNTTNSSDRWVGWVHRHWAVAVAMDRTWIPSFGVLTQDHQEYEQQQDGHPIHTPHGDQVKVDVFVSGARQKCFALLRRQQGRLDEQLEHLTTRYAATQQRLWRDQREAAEEEEDRLVFDTVLQAPQPRHALHSDDGANDDDQQLPVAQLEEEDPENAIPQFAVIERKLEHAASGLRSVQTTAYNLQVHNRESVQGPLAQADEGLKAVLRSSAKGSSCNLQDRAEFELVVCKALRSLARRDPVPLPFLLQMASTFGELQLVFSSAVANSNSDEYQAGSSSVLQDLRPVWAKLHSVIVGTGWPENVQHRVVGISMEGGTHEEIFRVLLG